MYFPFFHSVAGGVRAQIVTIGTEGPDSAGRRCQRFLVLLLILILILSLRIAHDDRTSLVERMQRLLWREETIREDRADHFRDMMP